MSSNSIALSLLTASLIAVTSGRFDRRVVDRAAVGDPRSEATHGYVGHDVTTGTANGLAFRQARGWMHYALTTFDDTEVTVALTLVGVDSMPRAYDVIVEDSLIATRTLALSTGASTVVEHIVPLVLTKGKANIAVTIRGRGGFTPALHEVRTVQDHNEDNTPGVVK